MNTPHFYRLADRTRTRRAYVDPYLFTTGFYASRWEWYCSQRRMLAGILSGRIQTRAPD